MQRVEDLDGKGFFVGDEETKEEFFLRVQNVEEKGRENAQIPFAHWDWPRIHLRDVYDFSPDCLPVWYSNLGLTWWQGAAAWVEGNRLVGIQLREAFRKGKFLFYKREEILVHEVVHAARSALGSTRFEEFFAYMAMESRWRRVLGPIVRRPWEVWPFLGFCVGGSLFPSLFLGAAIWAFWGFLRLAVGHWTLSRAAKRLVALLGSEKTARAILVRLTDREIERIAKNLPVGDDSLRWQVLRKKYTNSSGGEVWPKKSS